MRFRILFLSVVLQAGISAHAQGNLTPEPVYTRYFSFGGNINSRGWIASMAFGYRKDDKKTTELLFDLGRLKHEKEIRIVNPSFNNPRQYVFGRLNQTFVMRVGLNRKFALSEGLYNKSVIVNFKYGAGFSGMLLKPTYLEIYYRSQDQLQGEFITEKYDPVKHSDQNRIYGGAAFTNGLGEIRLTPGAFLKASFSFEWSPRSEDCKIIELGATLDMYPKEIPIMAFSPNHSTFLSLFAAFNICNKW